MQKNRERKSLKLAAWALGAALVAMSVPVLADNLIVNEATVADNVATFTTAGFAIMNYWIQAQGNDGQGGCNAADGTPAVVSFGLSGAPGVTVTPSQLTFVQCGQANGQNVNFTSSSTGTKTITASISDACTGNGCGTYSTSAATVTLTVNPPPPPSDTTPPVLSVTCNDAPCGAGWYTGDIAVAWSVSDPESTPTITSGCLSQTVNTDTSSLTLSCAASSAGGSNSTSVTLKRDATAPVISGSRSPGANGHGWNNVDVVVTFSCTDATSDVASFTAPVTLSAEGASQSVAGTCTDNAGNGAGVTVGGISIDKTGPSLGGSRSPAANDNGWNKEDVTVSFSCTDDLSGVDSYTGPITLSSEGAGQSAAGSCTDKAGNGAAASVGGISIDKTAPVLEGSRSPEMNANGWNNVDVTVSFSCTDGLSGVDVAPVSPQDVTTEGEGQSRSASCTDKAGNPASATVGNINIDKTAPGITFASRTAETGPGWNKAAVTVVWDCDDALSGPVAASVSDTKSSEGAGQTASGTCVDRAGNTAGASEGGINIDLTPPVITAGPAAQSFQANVAGGRNPTNYDKGTAGDLLSGLVSFSCPLTQSPGDFFGIGTANVVCTATDLAGNTNTANYAITVAYNFGGWLAPVANVPNVKRGSTLPLKFTLAGDSAAITQNGVFCFTLHTGSPVPTSENYGSVSSADSGLCFRYSDGHYIYNLATGGLGSGNSYEARLNIAGAGYGHFKVK